MPAHRFLADWRKAPWKIGDPGDAGALPSGKTGTVSLVVAAGAAETNTLGAPLVPGLLLGIVATSVGVAGTRTVTIATGYDVAGATTLVFNAARDVAVLFSIEVAVGTYRWCLIKAEGVTGPTGDAVVGTLSVATLTVTGALNMADDVYALFGTGSDVKLMWNGSYLEAGPASGLWAGAPSPADPQYHAIAHEFFDDFRQAPTDANLIWHETDDAATGTNAVLDAANGIGTVVTAAADNDYHAIDSIGESWLFAVGKKLWLEARFKLAEATTNESAWWVGLTDTLTTGGLQANALGPLASYDGALIWKDEATMSVNFETSNAAGQATAAAEATFVTDKWSRVGFYFDGAATTGVITPYYDMNEAGVWTVGTAKNITLAGLEEMHLVAGVKAGPTAAAETLQFDYVKVVQLR